MKTETDTTAGVECFFCEKPVPESREYHSMGFPCCTACARNIWKGMSQFEGFFPPLIVTKETLHRLVTP